MGKTKKKKSLEIIVLSAEDASKHVPKKPALAIRIFGSKSTGRGRDSYPNFPKRLYQKVLEYTFDDVDLKSCDELTKRVFALDYVLFDWRFARKIITQFKENYKPGYSVLVHCYAGISRSPAVALALKEIFKLKCKLPEFPHLNQYVYRTMLKDAREMGYEVKI
jgi:hypothetical protein